jgi:hypothetical protein
MSRTSISDVAFFHFGKILVNFNSLPTETTTIHCFKYSTMTHCHNTTSGKSAFGSATNDKYDKYSNGNAIRNVTLVST